MLAALKLILCPLAFKEGWDIKQLYVHSIPSICAPGTVRHKETERGKHISLTLKENTVKLGNKHATDYKPSTGVSAVAKEQMQAKVKVKVAQSCPTLCSPMDCMVFPGPVTGVGSLSPTPGDLPNPGIEPGSPALQAVCLPTEL